MERAERAVIFLIVLVAAFGFLAAALDIGSAPVGRIRIGPLVAPQFIPAGTPGERIARRIPIHSYPCCAPYLQEEGLI